MKVFTAAVSVALAVTGALAQGTQVTINTPPSAVVCQPLLLTWSGGTPPYFLSILPGNQPGAAALVDFGQVEGTSRSWLVNLPAGTQIGLTLRDSTGAVAQSAPFSIQSSTDTSCLNGGTSSSTSASGSTSSSTGTAVSTSTTATTATSMTAASTTRSVTTTAAATTPRPTSTNASSTTAPPASSTAAGNSASGKLSQISVAGAIGAVAAILFA